MTENRTHRTGVRVLLVALVLALAATAGAPGWIRIRRGDTLSQLARRYHTTVAALRALNKLPGNNLIIEGHLLRISAPPKPRPVPKATVRTVVVRYTVRPGDGVYRIANHFHAEPRWLVARNHLPKSWMVHPGQRLVVGVVRVVVPPRAAPLQRVPKAYVRVLVAQEARKAGMDPALALALAYEESGFQQHVVSSAGAIGVMQVMPRTGAWVSRYLVGRTLDLRRVEDNIVAGVRYLAMLTHLAKHLEQAIGGYYQGLTSVVKKGMYRDTKAYVAIVLHLRARFAGHSR